MILAYAIVFCCGMNLICLDYRYLMKSFDQVAEHCRAPEVFSLLENRKFDFWRTLGLFWKVEEGVSRGRGKKKLEKTVPGKKVPCVKFEIVGF